MTAQHRLTGLKKLKKRARIAGLVSVALAATSLTVLLSSHGANAQTKASASSAPSGDNGSVKVHDSSTPVTDPANNPHVGCQFYLDGFGFDPNQSVTWYIKSWPPTGNRTQVLNGSLSMGANGDGHTGLQSLPSGHYKLFWNFTGENGFAKQKVFWVKCTPTTPPTTPPATPTTPSCTCASTPPATPTTPAAPATVPSAPAPTPVTGSLPVTG